MYHVVFEKRQMTWQFMRLLTLVYVHTLQELRGRLVKPDQHNQLYGATNPAFQEDAEDEKEPELFGTVQKTLPCQVDDDIVQEDRPEDERESWDNKLMFLLATIG